MTSQNSSVRINSYKIVKGDTTELCFTKPSWLIIRDSLYEGSVARRLNKTLERKCHLQFETMRDVRIEIEGWKMNDSLCRIDKAVLKKDTITKGLYILTLQGDNKKLKSWLSGSIGANILLIILLVLL
jgi:hypothetical protein